MESRTSILNVGDTSFRRKKYMEEFKQILSLLRIHMNEYESWEKDATSQRDFYESVIYETDIFDRNENEDAKLAKRARTLTNSMVKVGLINNKRFVSEVGSAWLDDDVKDIDLFESMLSISTDNLVFFRQWSKFRFFDYEGKKYFSPFLFALKFLSRYDDVPEDHFLSILHSIRANSTECFVENSIRMYEQVTLGLLTFDIYYEKYVLGNTELKEELTSDIVNSIISEKVDENLFGKYFTNRKSQANTLPDYIYFVESLIKFRNNQSLDNYVDLRKASSIDSVKKAFGYNRLPFIFSLRRRNNLSELEEFKTKNIDNDLLFGDLSKIYYQFLDSKREDLLGEYKDLTKRLFNLSGVIEFKNSLINLPYKNLFFSLFENSNIHLVGENDFSIYEGNLNSEFYKNNTFLEYLGIQEQVVEAGLIEVSNTLNLPSVKELPDYYKNVRSQKIEDLINEKFNVLETMNILKLISERNDDQVSKIVTDSASVPTIFEYILTIAWYHISDKNFNILESFNLSLDASLLPLSHATGYKGDVEIRDTNPAFLIEATLMDTNNQKRNELEPVIRHTVNFAIEQQPTNCYGVFVANQIDDNVANIFRSCSKTELHHSQTKKTIKGVNIFAFTIEEIIRILEEDIKIDKIVKVFDTNIHENKYVNTGWRETVSNSIFR